MTKLDCQQLIKSKTVFIKKFLMNYSLNSGQEKETNEEENYSFILNEGWL